MYTQFMVDLTRWIFTIGSILGFSPFKVDRKVGKIYVHFWSRAWSFWNWSWLVAYSGLVLPTNLYELYVTKKHHQFNYTVIIMLCSSMGVVLVGDLVWKAPGICQFLNGTYKYIEDFTGKYMQNYDLKQDYRWTKFLEVAMLGSYIFCIWLGCMVAAHCYLRPFAPPYLIFNMDRRFVTTSVYLLASSWFAWFAVGVTAILGGIPSFGLFYFAYFLPIIKRELRLGCRSYKSSKSLRSSHHIVLNWRALEIFMKNLNVEMAFCFIYLQTIFIDIILFSFVTLTYQWDTLKLNTTVFLVGVSTFALLGWMAFLMAAGYQYSCSKKTINSWKEDYWVDAKDRLYMRKVKLSCRPCSFGDGKRYVIRPVTALKYITSVSKNTFRALITYDKVLNLL